MHLLELIQAALLEDMPSGDLTTESLATGPRAGTARLIAKADLVLSGSSAFSETILILNPDAELKWQFKDGDSILKGQTICLIRGDLIQILKAERVALNFLGHLSGIASVTHAFAAQVAHTSTQILDTRKTHPLYRDLERKAVRDGGGHNHRLNLSDRVLIKDNHIRAAGGITRAVQRVRSHTQSPIIVEASTQAEVEECVRCQVNRILLDNMTNDQMRDALAIIPDKIETEASGNMSVERVKSISELGVNFISVGALTHSAPFADVSLMFDWPIETGGKK